MPEELTANQQIAVLEAFMDIADREHAIGHAKAAVAAESRPNKPFVPEEHWAWAASKARETARRIRETGMTLQELLAENKADTE